MQFSNFLLNITFLAGKYPAASAIVAQIEQPGVSAEWLADTHMRSETNACGYQFPVIAFTCCREGYSTRLLAADGLQLAGALVEM